MSLLMTHIGYPYRICHKVSITVLAWLFMQDLRNIFPYKTFESVWICKLATKVNTNLLMNLEKYNFGFFG